MGDRSFPSKQGREVGSKKKDEHGQRAGDTRGQGMSENK